MVMKAPKFIMQNKQQLLKLLAGKLLRCNRAQTFFFLVFLISTLVFALRLLARFRKYRQQVEQGKQRERNKLFIDKLPCVICQDQFRNVILQPCNHLCVCEICFQKLENKCPVCKAQVANYQQIFIS